MGVMTALHKAIPSRQMAVAATKEMFLSLWQFYVFWFKLFAMSLLPVLVALADFVVIYTLLQSGESESSGHIASYISALTDLEEPALKVMLVLSLHVWLPLSVVVMVSVQDYLVFGVDGKMVLSYCLSNVAIFLALLIYSALFPATNPNVFVFLSSFILAMSLLLWVYLSCNNAWFTLLSERSSRAMVSTSPNTLAPASFREKAYRRATRNYMFVYILVHLVAIGQGFSAHVLQQRSIRFLGEDLYQLRWVVISPFELFLFMSILRALLTHTPGLKTYRIGIMGISGVGALQVSFFVHSGVTVFHVVLHAMIQAFLWGISPWADRKVHEVFVKMKWLNPNMIPPRIPGAGDSAHTVLMDLESATRYRKALASQDGERAVDSYGFIPSRSDAAPRLILEPMGGPVKQEESEEEMGEKESGKCWKEKANFHSKKSTALHKIASKIMHPSRGRTPRGDGDESDSDGGPSALEALEAEAATDRSGSSVGHPFSVSPLAAPPHEEPEGEPIAIHALMGLEASIWSHEHRDSLMDRMYAMQLAVYTGSGVIGGIVVVSWKILSKFRLAVDEGQEFEIGTAYRHILLVALSSGLTWFMVRFAWRWSGRKIPSMVDPTMSFMMALFFFSCCSTFFALTLLQERTVCFSWEDPTLFFYVCVE